MAEQKPPAHSTFGASKFESLMLCPGKFVLEAGLPNRASKYAAEGTAAHQVLTWALQESRPASACVGRLIEADGFVFEVDDDMASHVQVCLDYVADVAGETGFVIADTKVNYANYLHVEEDEAWGTADVIILLGDEIVVVDFKYGMGVEVSAERNPQMSLYALGALTAYNGLAGDFNRVRMTISQPRISKAPSEFDLPVAELEEWGRSAARSAVASCLNAVRLSREAREWDTTFLRPGEKQCKFCKAKAECPALRNDVVYTVAPAQPAELSEFEVVKNLQPGTPDSGSAADWLATCLSKVDMIEDWCKAIRAESERRLLAGEAVPGFKVVKGKRGARQWSDAAAAESLLKTFRLKQEEMYEFKLISPTTAEKLAKAETIGKRQWPKLKGLIVQNDGKPHVAPESDSRPALDIRPVLEDFDNVADEPLA